MIQFLRHIPAYIPTFLVLVAICYLSLAGDPFPDKERFFDFPGSDKVVHLLMYATLTATFCFDYYRRRASSLGLCGMAVVLVVAIGVGMLLELLQGYMALGRTADFVDFIANSAGAVVGVLVGNKIFARLFSSSHLPN